MSLVVRPATEADLPCIPPLYDHSRRLMRQSGNQVQWVGGYPSLDTARADLRSGALHVICPQQWEGLAGVFSLVDGVEPTYDHIVDGRWVDNQHPYATLHRLASAPGQRGVAHAAFLYAKKRFAYLRADTHPSNAAMLHILQRELFVRSGVVHMADGTPRVAFEWWRHDAVPASLRQYVQQEVLPRYAAFDAAHRQPHALRVVARAMLMGQQLGLAPSLTYAAAAMHDLGLAHGRDEHHLHGGAIVRADQRLAEWFDADEVEQIAQAVEDHRASASAVPRSLLGKVVAEADRDIEPLDIVRRTVCFGLDHYPHLPRHEHWQRTLQHLNEKYAEGGYLHLLLPNSPNAAPLAELRALIASEGQLHQLFDQLFDQYSTPQ